MRNLPPPNRILTILLIITITAGCGSKSGSTEKMAEAMKWTDKEYVLFQEQKFDSALYCLNMADSLEPDNDTVRAYTSAERAVILSSTGKMRDCVPFARQSIDISLKIEDYETALNMYNTLGVVYRRLGDSDSALYYYKKGLDLTKYVESKDYVANLMTCIAVIYAQKDRMKEALSYVDKAERFAKMATDTIEGKIELYNVLGTKGGILTRQNRYKEAVSAIEPYIEDIIRTGRAPYILKCANPLISAYAHLGLTDKADSMIHRLRPIIEDMGAASNGAIGILETEAKLHSQRKEYKEELENWKTIERLNSKNLGTQPQELFYHKAECYHNLGDDAEAWENMRQAYLISDSLKNSGINEQLSKFSIRYKTQEKELELSRVKQEKAQQQLQSLMVITALIIGCAVLAIIIIRIQHRRKLARQSYEIEMSRRFIQGMEDERARLARELHDGICNDLLGLSMLMSQNDNRCLNMVKQIRSNTRRISHELMPPRFTEVDIDTVLRDYIERYPVEGCAITYISTHDKDWNTVDDIVAYEFYRITQETMGNIIKHSRPSFVRTSLCLSNGVLRLTIDNNGVPSTAKNTTDGIGSQTIQDRAAYIGGTLSATVSNGEYNFTVSASANSKHNKTVIQQTHEHNKDTHC